MSGLKDGLRDRTRRAVTAEIADAAHALFVTRGYTATTMNDIAAQVGLSPRSLFRYFATKEDLVIGKFELFAEEMLEALQARPAGEAVWLSLRRLFDGFAAHADAPDKHEAAEPIQRIVFDTPALFAAYLQKLQQVQDAVVTELLARAAALDTPYAKDDPAPRALAAAAFGCLVAAQHAWLASGAETSFAGALDRAMAVVRPAR